MTTSLDTGAVIDGKYRLGRRLGEGGMGTVFEGENLRIKRKVAIKLLHEHVAATPEFSERFVREARASARIGSQHICDVLDLGDLETGEKYLVMELLDGESLEERLDRQKKMNAVELAPIAFEILEGLGAMHQVGVVHRDLKPANVFLCKRPGNTVFVKLLDFGVAKIVPSESDPSGVVNMTTTGTMMGTPLYMSPEQARGARDVDGRTDLYAASVILYRALTGDVPHSGTSLHELLFKIVLDAPRPIKELAPEVDDELAAIVTKGLARDPEERYSSAREYQEALAAWGEKHGLSFKVTLPSEPPPLRKQTGGFPAAKIQEHGAAARTGNTPLGVRGDSQTTRAAATADPQPNPKAGGDTLVTGAEPKPPSLRGPEVAVSEPTPAAKAPAAGASSKSTIAIGAIVAIAAAIIGVKLGTADAPRPAPPPSPTPTPTLPAPPLSVPIAAASSPPREAVPPPAVDAAVATPPPPVAAPTPPPRPSGTAAATPSAGGRIFRTDAGF